MVPQRELGTEIAAALGYEFVYEFLGATQPQIMFTPVVNGDGYVSGEFDMTLRCHVNVQNLLIAVPPHKDYLNHNEAA